MPAGCAGCSLLSQRSTGSPVLSVFPVVESILRRAARTTYTYDNRNFLVSVNEPMSRVSQYRSTSATTTAT